MRPIDRFLEHVVGGIASPIVQRVCTGVVVVFAGVRILRFATRFFVSATTARGSVRTVSREAFTRIAHEPLAKMDEKFASPALLQLLTECTGPGAEGRPDADGVYDYQVAARSVGRMFASGVLSVDDCTRPTSEKLFWIHRTTGPRMRTEGGHAVRITVQCNLFAGTIASIGSARQRAQLAEIFQKGEIGSFALTERGAGVLSGLVVETTATYSKDGWSLHTPTESAEKYWISNGLVAKWSVVVARLIVPKAGNEKFANRRTETVSSGDVLDLGPHVFLIDLDAAEKTGKFVRTDMAPKTEFNSLDNAYFKFKSGCVVPHDTLLSRICDVDARTGAYSLADPLVPFRFEIMASRLLSGRICIAHAAIDVIESTLKRVREYSRPVMTSPTERTELRDLPIVRDHLALIDDVADVLRIYSQEIQQRFIRVDDAQLPTVLEPINCAKIIVIEWALQSIEILKTKVGAFCLTKASPWSSSMEILRVFMYAEGDCSILSQKTARDVVTATMKKPFAALKCAWSAAFGGSQYERAHAQAILRLGVGMMFLRDKDAQRKHWFAMHETVVAVARMHCLMTIRETVLRKVGAHSEQIKSFDKVFHLDQ